MSVAPTLDPAGDPLLRRLDRLPHPVLGFYGPGTQMWRINREAVLLGSGACALLLQVAHPLVAEGVAQHSAFPDDAFGRLRRTLRTTLDLVFGDAHRALRAARRLNGIHGRVRGPVEDADARRVAGADAYRAMDPALLLWVQATLIVTSVQAYERWVGAVTEADKDRFWQEAREFGVLLGIPLDASPRDWPALMAYWDAMLAADGPIQPTATSRAIARDIVRPPLPLVPRPLTEVLALPSVAMLPPRIRDAYGLPFGPGRRAVAAAMDLAIRGWIRLVPPGPRAFPPARDAERRARAIRAEADDAGGPSQSAV